MNLLERAADIIRGVESLAFTAEIPMLRTHASKWLNDYEEMKVAEDESPQHRCGCCGQEMQIVRPGKYRCLHCEATKTVGTT